MPSIAQTIRDFRAGACSEAEFLVRLEETLDSGKSQPAALLKLIEAQNSELPFPAELLSRLTDRIVSHMNTAADSTAAPPDTTNDATRLATVLSSDDNTGKAQDHSEQDDDATAFAPTSILADERKHAVGTIINDRFVLEELAGQGGMSVVYRAVDKRKLEARSRNPHVAVKILEVSSKNESAAFMALQREAQKSQTLYHPNIVRAFDFDRDGDTVFMTMEYLSGTPLSETIRGLNKKGMELNRAMKLIEQMGAALSHAHSHRIVHADFKPGNVILTESEQIKVIDFGIARAYQRPDDSVSDKTLFDPRALGALTPAYASPEMLDNLEPDPKDDIYSLGCVTYELITGVHPFSKTRATDARDVGLRPRKPGNLDRRQWRALSKALAFDREERTGSVAKFLEDFLPRPPRSHALTFGGIGLFVLVAGGLWFGINKPGMDSESTNSAATTPEPASSPIPTPKPLPPPAPEIPPAGQIFRDCNNCPQLIVLPTGSATIGSPASELNRREFEGPQFQFNIETRFAMSVTEVSVQEFQTFVTATDTQIEGCHTLENDWRLDSSLNWRNPGFNQSGSHPVTCISWDDANAYVRWLSKLTDAQYRLPSEAEWEYAARAGVETSTLWGTDSACSYANVADNTALENYPGWQVVNCKDNAVNTAKVGQRRANSFGLHDMQGNLFEWTRDCWIADYNNSDFVSKSQSQPASLSEEQCEQRVLRGGSWYTAPSEQRLAFRNRAHPSDRSNTFGFRVLKELP